MTSPLSPSSSLFGKSWVSPELMTRKICHFSELRTCDGWIIWCERRPQEQGRSVIVGYSDQDAFIDLIPEGFSVGSDVNEYGGGAWCVFSVERERGKQREIIFHDAIKGGIWRSVMGKAPQLIMPKEWNGHIYSYADFAYQDGKIFCVRESKEHPQKMDVIMINEEDSIEIIAEGSDFYAAPRPSPDGKFIAWIAWDNPHMPWTSSQLYLAPLSHLEEKICLEGLEASVSVMEPFWCGSKLYALSDNGILFHNEKERHWTICAFSYDQENGWKRQKIKAAPYEIGFPQWVFGQRSYHVFPNGEILACGHREGKLILLAYQKEGEEYQWNEHDFYGEMENIPQILTSSKSLEEACYCWINQSEESPPFIAKSFLQDAPTIIKAAWLLPKEIEKDDISRPEFISSVARDGASPLYGLFYKPAQGGSTSALTSKGGKPPLMVLVHGGPTAQAQRAFSFKVQYWTSRGFAVLDVNYRGSTGFGRTYRDALNGQWGVIDVHDCCDLVRYVQRSGWVDEKRTVIRGSSAGGLTVLSAIAHSDLFVGGTSLYGVTDLTALTQETHRFEAYYLEGLVAPYPEGEAVYKARSPLSWAEKITAPIFFFHGGKDRVVPLEHAKALYEQLPQAFFHLYPEEGHGFRSPEVQADMFQRELEFYLKLFSV